MNKLRDRFFCVIAITTILAGIVSAFLPPVGAGPGAIFSVTDYLQRAMDSVSDEARSLDKTKYIKDFDGNILIIGEFLPAGYIIHEPSVSEVIEIEEDKLSPYSGQDGRLYYAYGLGYFTGCGDGLYYNLSSGKYLSDIDEIERYIEHSRSSFETIRENGSTITLGRVYADVEVPHSWYFKRCLTNFAYAEIGDGSCGYVALAMLLGYSEIFLSAGIFSDEESAEYITNASGDPAAERNVPGVSDSFIDCLYSLHPKKRTTASSIKKVSEKFLAGKRLEYRHRTSYLSKKAILSEIDSGRPVILFGNMPRPNGGRANHAAVVYGYYGSGERLLVHYGWDYTQETVLTSYLAGSVYSLEYLGEHQHGGYFDMQDETVCSCRTPVKPLQ